MHIYDFFKRKMSNSFTSFNLEKVIIQYHLEMINVMLVKLLIKFKKGLLLTLKGKPKGTTGNQAQELQGN